MKYHPDRTNEINLKKKFKNISNAYQFLLSTPKPDYVKINQNNINLYELFKNININNNEIQNFYPLPNQQIFTKITRQVLMVKL